MKAPWVRGAVWMAVGALVHLGGLAFGRPPVLRGTSVPWGLLVAIAGVAILIWDVARSSRRPPP